MIDKFEELIKDLSINLSIPLRVDEHGFCTIKVDEKVLIQLQLDKSKEFLFIGSFLTEIPPGKFREKIFIQTLKANGQIPKLGTFAFNDKTLELLLFEYLHFEKLTPKYLNEYLANFIEKAFDWKEAIESNQSAPKNFILEEKTTKSLYNGKL